MNEHRLSFQTYFHDITIPYRKGVRREYERFREFFPSQHTARAFTQKKAIKDLINYSKLFQSEAEVKLY